MIEHDGDPGPYPGGMEWQDQEAPGQAPGASATGALTLMVGGRPTTLQVTVTQPDEVVPVPVPVPGLVRFTGPVSAQPGQAIVLGVGLSAPAPLGGIFVEIAGLWAVGMTLHVPAGQVAGGVERAIPADYPVGTSTLTASLDGKTLTHPVSIFKPSPPPPPPPVGINVRDRGLKGDGVTDDTPALNALIAAVPEGATLNFDLGTYLIQEARVNKSGLKFRGNGAIISHGKNHGLTISGQLTGIEVSGLQFRGAPGQYALQGNVGAALAVFGAKRLIVRNCFFRGCGLAMTSGSAVGPEATYGTIVEDCNVEGFGAQAFFCNGGEQIRRVQIIQDDPGRFAENKSEHGFYLRSGCSNVLIEDVLVENARWYGAQNYGADPNTVNSNNVFRRVHFKNCRAGLIFAGGQPTAAVAKGCIVRDCTFTGIYDGAGLHLKQGEVFVANNKFISCDRGIQLGVFGSWESGYRVGPVAINGNMINSCRIGIWASTTAGTNNTIIATVGPNIIENCPTPILGQGTAGIRWI